MKFGTAYNIFGSTYCYRYSISQNFFISLYTMLMNHALVVHCTVTTYDAVLNVLQTRLQFIHIVKHTTDRHAIRRYRRYCNAPGWGPGFNLVISILILAASKTEQCEVAGFVCDSAVLLKDVKWRIIPASGTCICGLVCRLKGDILSICHDNVTVSTSTWLNLSEVFTR